MGTSLQDVLGRLRMAAAVHTLSGLADGELLERFLFSRDESAFTVLIERHGPMVHGVCRRALASHADVEDACQATFLVLARKANSLLKRESLASWIHSVVCRVVIDQKRKAARRRNHERRIEVPSPVDPASECARQECLALLDEELERLPEWYRTPLILCYLERLTRAKAAARLGLSPGRLHGRLERGRDLLRQRLTRRGLTLSTLLSATALSEGATLPSTLVVSSAKAAATFITGRPLTELVGAQALTLTREVLKTMYLAKVKLGSAAVLCTVLLALVGGAFTSRGEAQDSRATPHTGLAKIESDEAFIRRISKDLRAKEPTPAEVHFFVSAKDSAKRDKLIDLFILERQAKKVAEGKDQKAKDWATVIGLDDKQLPQVMNDRAKAEVSKEFEKAAIEELKKAEALARTQQEAREQEAKKIALERAQADLSNRLWMIRLEDIQREFAKELKAAKTNEEVAKVMDAHLMKLTELKKAQPGANANPGWNPYQSGTNQPGNGQQQNPDSDGQPGAGQPSNQGSNGTNAANDYSQFIQPGSRYGSNSQQGTPRSGQSQPGYSNWADFLKENLPLNAPNQKNP